MFQTRFPKIRRYVFHVVLNMCVCVCAWTLPICFGRRYRIANGLSVPNVREGPNDIPVYGLCRVMEWLSE